jgi:hypothetical protein
MHNWVVTAVSGAALWLYAPLGYVVVCASFRQGAMVRSTALRRGTVVVFGGFPRSAMVYTYAPLCGLAQWSYAPLYDAAQWLCAPVNTYFINVFLFTYPFLTLCSYQSTLYDHQHLPLPLLFFLLVAG